MSNLSKLFELIPSFKEAIKDEPSWKISSTLLKVLKDELDDIDSVLSSAFSVYSKQGFYASPQVNHPDSWKSNFFDWNIINIVRRTGDCTEHQFIRVETHVFIIQYLITGGFNGDLDYTKENLINQFSEACLFLKNVLGVDYKFG